MFMFQVCFGSNCSKKKFQTVTSGMQIGGVTVKIMFRDPEQLIPSKQLLSV